MQKKLRACALGLFTTICLLPRFGCSASNCVVSILKKLHLGTSYKNSILSYKSCLYIKFEKKVLEFKNVKLEIEIRSHKDVQHESSTTKTLKLQLSSKFELNISSSKPIYFFTLKLKSKAAPYNAF